MSKRVKITKKSLRLAAERIENAAKSTTVEGYLEATKHDNFFNEVQ